MDDLNCCLSQVVHLCIETSIFVDQLTKFEYEFSKFSSSYHHPSRKYFSILHHFSIIINDLNIYYENNFSEFYSNVSRYLSRKHFTVNMSNEIYEDVYEDLKYFLNHQKIYYKNIFNYLHKLSITCLLCIQYSQLCTTSELTNRFVYMRIDLLTDLRNLNDEIKFLLIEINRNFERKKQILIKNPNHRSLKEKIRMLNFSLWFVILFLIGCYFIWPIGYESKQRQVGLCDRYLDDVA